MKSILLPFFLNLVAISCFGQINLADSTVQVIGFWNLKDKQSYTITTENYTVLKGDTSKKDVFRYEVELSIIDSTANSYTIQWDYKNQRISSDNELLKKMESLTQNRKIIVKTDEMGAFQEIVNWQAIKDTVDKKAIALKEELQSMDKSVDQILGMYTNKETIECNAIRDVLQFYYFHGGKYKMGEEINTIVQVPNFMGGEPLDSNSSVWLDEINSDHANSVFRTIQSVDSVPLAKLATDTTIRAMLAGTSWLSEEQRPIIKQEVYSATRIHESGWILFSVLTQAIEIGDLQKVNEVTIEMLSNITR